MAPDNKRTRNTEPTEGAERVGYQPAVPGEWSPVPSDVEEALDAIRAKKGEHHMAFFTSAEGVSFDETGIL